MQACSLLTSLDDLHGDAAAPVDATSSDVAVDAGGGDVADVVAPDVSLPFCPTLDASNVLFCEDFDQTDAAFFPNWTPFGVTPQRDGVSFSSAPFALLATAPASDSGATQQSYIQRTYNTSPSHVVFSFDALVATADTLGNYAYVNQLSIYTDAGEHTEYRVEASQTKTQFVVSVTPGTAVSTFTLPNAWLGGGWHHVVMDLEVAAIPATATITIDGTVQLADASAPAATFGAGGKMIIKAGIASTSPTPETGWAIDIDNVVVQTPP